MEANEDEPEDVRKATPVVEEVRKGQIDEDSGKPTHPFEGARKRHRCEKETVKKKPKEKSEDCCRAKKAKLAKAPKTTKVLIYEKPCTLPRIKAIPRHCLTKQEWIDILATPSRKCPSPCLQKLVTRKIRPVSPRMEELAQPPKHRLLNTLEKKAGILPIEFIDKLIQNLEGETCLTPEQAEKLFRDKEGRSKKKCRKKKSKTKCPAEKLEGSMEAGSSFSPYDREAVHCQYAIAESFVKSLLDWKSPIPKEEFADIAQVITRRLSEALSYNPINGEDRKSQQMRYLADVIGSWISGVLFEVADTRKTELEEECERRKKLKDEEESDDESDDDDGDDDEDRPEDSRRDSRKDSQKRDDKDDDGEPKPSDRPLSSSKEEDGKPREDKEKKPSTDKQKQDSPDEPKDRKDDVDEKPQESEEKKTPTDEKRDDKKKDFEDPIKAGIDKEKADKSEKDAEKKPGDEGKDDQREKHDPEDKTNKRPSADDAKKPEKEGSKAEATAFSEDSEVLAGTKSPKSGGDKVPGVPDKADEKQKIGQDKTSEAKDPSKKDDNRRKSETESKVDKKKENTKEVEEDKRKKSAENTEKVIDSSSKPERQGDVDEETTKERATSQSERERKKESLERKLSGKETPDAKLEREKESVGTEPSDGREKLVDGKPEGKKEISEAKPEARTEMVEGKTEEKGKLSEGKKEISAGKPEAGAEMVEGKTEEKGKLPEGKREISAGKLEARADAVEGRKETLATKKPGEIPDRKSEVKKEKEPRVDGEGEKIDSRIEGKEERGSVKTDAKEKSAKDPEEQLPIDLLPSSDAREKEKMADEDEATRKMRRSLAPVDKIKTKFSESDGKWQKEDGHPSELAIGKKYRTDTPFVTFDKIFHTIYNAIEESEENDGSDAIANRIHRAVYEKFSHIVQEEKPGPMSEMSRDVLEVMSGKIALWLRNILTESQIDFVNRFPATVESTEIREWTGWISFVSDIAEDWSEWIGNTIREMKGLNQQVDTRQITRGDYKDWTKSVDVDALRWRRFYLESLHRGHQNLTMVRDRQVVKAGTREFPAEKEDNNEKEVKITNLENEKQNVE